MDPLEYVEALKAEAERYQDEGQHDKAILCCEIATDVIRDEEEKIKEALKDLAVLHEAAKRA